MNTNKVGNILYYIIYNYYFIIIVIIVLFLNLTYIHSNSITYIFVLREIYIITHYYLLGTMNKPIP